MDEQLQMEVLLVNHQTGVCGTDIKIDTSEL